MIELINVSKSFEDKQILEDVSLSVSESNRSTIIGPSGAGKSTILKLIVGLTKPDSGKILINGIDITTINIEKLNELRRSIGLLFQSGALFDSLTVEENILFPLIEQKKRMLLDSTMKRKCAEVLEMVDMLGHEYKYPTELSGGQKKRVGLARALISKPKILLYDEPTTGLDPVLSTNIEDLINKLSTELSVTSIIVTHQLSTIYRTSDYIYYLKNGILCSPETPNSISDSKDVTIRNFINGKAS
ncbi:ABC transporter ATP-binding protein [Candidatus Marinamargulisbacteria bacterium SCGC AG-414-C22]|nr:ABC transporter ATP-binding protein [Candidatus Marinamargulisbacteria bacterium SCGC AG-414-C22]